VLAASRAWVNDDAFITFRYAAHLAAGHGFVWNLDPPRHVDGSTSLAWTCLTAGALRAGGDRSYSRTSQALIAGIGVLLVAWLGAWANPPARPARSRSPPLPSLRAAQRWWWSVSGMESSPAALAMLIATLLLLREDASAFAFRSTAPSLRLGMGSGLVFLIAPRSCVPKRRCSFAAAPRSWQSGVTDVRGRSSRPRAPCTGGSDRPDRLAPDVLRTALPNPFYVKVGTFAARHGLQFLAQFALQYQAWLWGGAMLLAAPWSWRRARVATAVLGAQLLVFGLWLVAIGGDVWEFRFLVRSCRSSRSGSRWRWRR
jgi:hypothetical protein